MNAYQLGYCPECETFHSGSTLLVHGSFNKKHAIKLLKEGHRLKTVFSLFCGYCGEYAPGNKCSCGNYQEQKYSKE